jgi:hypothetical protein
MQTHTQTQIKVCDYDKLISVENSYVQAIWIYLVKGPLFFIVYPLLHKTALFWLCSELLLFLSNGIHRGGGCQAVAPPKPPKQKFNKHRFCRDYDIKRIYVISPSSEISSWNRLMTRALEFEKQINKIKKKNKKTGHCDWVMEHVVIFVCI